MTAKVPTIWWERGSVKLIDQTLLPNRFKVIVCRDTKTLWQAIKRLSVRGAPAIGVAAGFGVLLGMKTFRGSDADKFMAHVHRVADYLATSRPTAVNLFNVLDRMRKVCQSHSDKTVVQLRKLLTLEALAVYEEDRRVCRAMGDHGAKLVRTGTNVMTICNAGALATVDYGTALGVFYSAKKMKKKFKVYACETRPLLQGARLTAWELTRGGIDTTLICDNMAATLMQKGKVQGIFAGADRIAANGDTANKIGTYNLAVLAKYHGVPFYIVAPLSTFDLKTKDGRGIPIEERGRDEVVGFRRERTAPQGIKVFNPAFDVTPNKLITGIVTEKGVLRRPYTNAIKKVMINGY